MRVHPFLATEAGLRELLDAGTPPAGPRGPSIDRPPVEAVDALGNAEAADLAHRASEWTGGAGRPKGAPERALESLAELAASRQSEQELLLWVSDG